MTEPERCPQCGAPLPPGVAPETCPKCLLNLGFLSAGGEESTLAAPSGTPPERPGQIGPYRLLTVLGEGGMGTVYLAEQREPIQRRVALKVIKRGMDTREVIARFESERQALALMSHPGIARVFDAGSTADGLPYFVMEHVSGVPITEYCDRNRLSAEERLRLFIGVCESVQHAHRKGIIHRDLKPSNVLVTIEEGAARTKVIDFGVSKAIGQRLTEKTLFTQRGVLVGTPGYMSPEQAEMTELDVDTRTDVYSLGVLLYELLVGALPFDPRRLREAGWGEMQRIIRDEEPAKPSTRVFTLGEEATTVADRRQTDPGSLRRALRGDLDWITLKALEKDRTRRYGTAAEFAADIERHLEHEPVAASPPDAVYRFKKLVRRHRGVFAAAAAIVAALVAGLILTLLQYRSAEAARRETRRQVVALSVAAGARLVDGGDYLAALPWYVRALGLEEGGAEREDVHRRRIGAILERSPRLVRAWALGEPVRVAVISPDGALVAGAGSSGAFRVWRSDSAELAWEGRHAGEIVDLRFDPRGHALVTASADGTLRVWDALGGRPLTEPLRHELQVSSAVFSPDGRRILSASYDGTARIWETDTGRLLRSLPHGEQVYFADFSPDGTRVATACGNGTAFVYDAETGRRLAGPIRDIRFISIVAFRPDGRAIATGGASTGPRLWDATTGEPLSPPLRHDAATAWVTFSRDGRYLATFGFDGTIRIWDPADGRSLAAPLKHAGGVLWAEFSSDGRHVVSAVEKGLVRVWRTADWKPVDPPLPHAGPVSQARFDATGRFVLTASEDGLVRMFDLAGGEPEHPSIQLDCTPYRVALLSGGRRLLTQCGLFRDPQTYVRVWDVEDAEPVTPPLRHALHAVFDVDAEGRRVATGGADLQVRLWDATTGEPTSPPVSQGARFVTGVRFSPDGRRLVSVSGDLVPGYQIEKRPGEVWVRSVSSGEPLFPALHRDLAVSTGWFSGERVAFVEGGRRVSVVDGRTGRSAMPSQALTAPQAYATSRDGRFLATFDEKRVEVRRLSDGSLVGTPIEFAGVVFAEFSPDAAKIATGNADGSVRVWEVSSGRQIGPPAEHGGSVVSLRFSDDGRFLVCADQGGASRVSDARDGSPVTPPLPLEGGGRDVVFTPDLGRILGAAADGEVRVWEFAVESRALPALVQLAGLLSGIRVDASGARYPLQLDELEKVHADLERSEPELLAVSPRRAAAWHRRAALEAARGRDWNRVVREATTLVALGARRASDLELRGGAFAEMRRWPESLADFREAAACRPDDVFLRRDVALALLASGDRDGFRQACLRLLDDFSETSNPDNAHAIARTLTLWADPPPDVAARTLEFAEIATRGVPRYRPWRSTHAAAAYRAGEAPVAQVILQQIESLDSISGADRIPGDVFPDAFGRLAFRRKDSAPFATEAEDWRSRVEASVLEAEVRSADRTPPSLQVSGRPPGR